MIRITIEKQDAGQRLDKYLKRIMPEISSGLLYKSLRKKNITLNGKKAEGKELLCVSDTVSIFFSEETFAAFQGKKSASMQEDILAPYHNAFKRLYPIEVVYESEDVVFFNKPAGVLSQKALQKDVSINEYLIGYMADKGEVSPESLSYFKPSVCNRLDRNTSGLILCGKTLPGSRMLTALLKERTLHKYYIAYASGKITEKVNVSGFILKNERENKSSFSKEKMQGAKPSSSIITPLYYDERNNLTKCKVLLITGKSHQIRVHMSYLGHPLLGDVKYGFSEKEGHTIDIDHTGHYLHAYELIFPEIQNEEVLLEMGLSGKRFTAPLPPDFQKLDVLCRHGKQEG